MRPISRVVVARDAAWRITGAACGGQDRVWSALEAAHADASTPAESGQTVAAARRWCDQCPAAEACALWAALEQYTGLAAGAAYENGQRRPATWVAGRPGPVIAEAVT